MFKIVSVVLVILHCQFVLSTKHVSAYTNARNPPNLFSGVLPGTQTEGAHQLHRGITSDADAIIERPCLPGFMSCIREYFSRNSLCQKVKGPVPDPVIRHTFVAFIASVNLTVSGVDARYSGLNAKIIDLYINKATDNLVISLEFGNSSIYVKESYYRFHRVAKEPVVNMDYLYIKLTPVITTTTIPGIHNLQLENSVTYAYVEDPNIMYKTGPKAFVSSDPSIPATSEAIDAMLPTVVQEFFLTQAAFGAITYIQSDICDFGVKVL